MKSGHLPCVCLSFKIYVYILDSTEGVFIRQIPEDGREARKRENPVFEPG